MPALGLLTIGAFVLFACIAAMRSGEVFYVSVRRGRCLVVRGRVPTALLASFEDIVCRTRLRCATIRAVRRGGETCLEVSGASEAAAQRLRNVFGASPMKRARLPNLPAERHRNLGQRLGWAWLAWRLGH